jgi:phosphatidylglycerophosphatase A
MKQVPLLHKIIATGFGAGYAPKAPGTAGAALAWLMWWALGQCLPPCGLFAATLVLIAVFTALGVWSSGIAEQAWGKDPSRVVVDEMVGVWIPLLAVSNGNIYLALAAFVLFRAFDIFKPLGIRKAEALRGGWGIMADDVVAGLYSLVILLAVKWLV